MLKKTATRQSKFFMGLTGLAALVLMTACSSDGTAEQPPADQQVEEQTAQPEQTPPAATADDATAATTDASASDDAVFAIIDAVEAEYSNGFIVDVDTDDDESDYDVEIVVGNELHELDVTADGTITVDETDTDDDKIAKAGEATVTVTDALKQAFEQHPNATFDQIDLDEDNGSLQWEIELDDTDGSDIELKVPAM